MLMTLSEINTITSFVDRSVVMDVMTFCAAILLAYSAFTLGMIRQDLINIHHQIFTEGLTTREILLLLQALSGNTHRSPDGASDH